MLEYQAALRPKPDYVEDLDGLGLALLRCGRVDDALDALLDALALAGADTAPQVAAARAEEDARLALGGGADAPAAASAIGHRLRPSASDINFCHQHWPSASVIGFGHRLRPSTSAIDFCHRQRPSASAISFGHRLLPSASAIGFCPIWGEGRGQRQGVGWTNRFDAGDRRIKERKLALKLK